MLGEPLQAQEAALQQERQRAQQMQQEFQSKEAEHLRKQRGTERRWNECADRCVSDLHPLRLLLAIRRIHSVPLFVMFRACLALDSFACNEGLQQCPGCSLPGTHDSTLLLWAP